MKYPPTSGGVLTLKTVFSGFLRNPRKYLLGSVRKTPPHGGHSTYSPRSHKRTIGQKPTTSQPFMPQKLLGI